jgi:hypothetical protein
MSENLIVAHLRNKITIDDRTPKNSYSYAQEPIAMPYPEPNEASSHTFSHFPSYVNLIFQTGLFASGFLFKPLCACLSPFV